MSNEDPTSKIIMPILVAMIGLLGGLAGVLIGSHLSTEAAKEIAQVEYKNELLQQRVKLLNRATLIYGKAPGIQDIWRKYLQPENESSEGSVELSKTLAEYNAEFNAVMSLSSVYFGPKTHEALKTMAQKSSPWWEKDGQLVQDYIGAMASELKYGIE